MERGKPSIARSEQQLQRLTDWTWNRHLSHVLDSHRTYKRENWMIFSNSLLSSVQNPLLHAFSV
ncbi:hypothetical protein C1H46_011946 [Malus baccata]|uniref:Uncharacterized protein n=1 Tax=Malus baccata TaxID=106549 RepID=A0A540MUI0_MALBA|nr:hypothetical protein C1H46_011946 [Malus baccata]